MVACLSVQTPNSLLSILFTANSNKNKDLNLPDLLSSSNTRLLSNILLTDPLMVMSEFQKLLLELLIMFIPCRVAVNCIVLFAMVSWYQCTFVN